MEVPTLPQVGESVRSKKYVFPNIKSFPFEWVFLRNPLMENYTFDKNGLILIATDISLNSGDNPTFAAIRQTDISFELSADISLEKSMSGTAAGISVYMEGSSHYDLYLCQKDNNLQTVKLEYTLNSIHGMIDTDIVLTPGEQIDLIVKGTPDIYEFYCNINGELKKVGSLDSRYLATETAGGFTGITLGLFATGEGIAIVKEMEYNSHD